MQRGWDVYVRNNRRRYGLTQAQLAVALGVAQRTVSRWERGEDQPSLGLQKRLRDLGWEPSDAVIQSLAASVVHCPVPRALSRMPGLHLLALSRPAIIKRPSIVEWIGRDLTPLATGYLKELLDDNVLQRAIRQREIAGIVATSPSVLRTREVVKVGLWRTTITYFHHDGVVFSDAVAVPADADAPVSWRAIPMDEIPVDLA